MSSSVCVAMMVVRSLSVPRGTAGCTMGHTNTPLSKSSRVRSMHLPSSPMSTGTTHVVVRAGLVRMPAGKEKFARVRHLCQALRTHLEDAYLPDGTEPVLDGP